jgi:hypothetical protein
MKTAKATWLLGLIGVGVLLLGVCIPILVQRVRMERKRDCFGNLCIINHNLNCGAAMERGLRLGDPLTKQDVESYCKGGVIPTCPSGGTYEFDFRVGSHPVCSVHGNLIAGTGGEEPHQPLRRPLQIDYFPTWVTGTAMCSIVIALGIPVFLFAHGRRKQRGSPNHGADPIR